MSLFGKIIKTAVNVAIVPAALAVDIAILPVTAIRAGEGEKPLTLKALETLKREADEG